MPNKFKTLGELAQHLQTVNKKYLPSTYKSILRFVGEVASEDARERIIGRIQPLGQVGSFPAWKPLQDATVDAKASQGLGKGGDPRSILYASGALYSSITFRVNYGAKTTYIGSNSPYAAVHEYGAPAKNIPPRPFLGPAMYRSVEKNRLKMEKWFGQTLDGQAPFRGVA